MLIPSNVFNSIQLTTIFDRCANIRYTCTRVFCFRWVKCYRVVLTYFFCRNDATLFYSVLLSMILLSFLLLSIVKYYDKSNIVLPFFPHSASSLLIKHHRCHFLVPRETARFVLVTLKKKTKNVTR